MTAEIIDWQTTAIALEKQLQRQDRIIAAQQKRLLSIVHRWMVYCSGLEQKIAELERELEDVKEPA